MEGCALRVSIEVGMSSVMIEVYDQYQGIS
jgi:hypothetical protein